MDNEQKINKNTKKQNNKTTQKKENNTKKSTQKNINTKRAPKKENNTKTVKKDNKELMETKKDEAIEIIAKENKKEIVEEKKENIESIEADESTEKPNKAGLVILALLLIIIGICIFYQIDNKNNDSDKNVTVESSNEIMDNFYKYFNNKKAKIIYYASSTCGYCELETPIMEQIDKDYDIDYLYIDSTKLTESDRKKMLKELDIEHATPTTVIVKNGKVIDTQVGYVDGGEMVDFLVENKILQKDAVYTPEQYLTFINYEEYVNILEQEGKQIITIGQTGCSHCIATKPVLNTIAENYEITINYLNISEMTQSERNSFINSLSEIGYDEEEFVSTGKFGTPLTLIIENGKVISYVSGERPTAQFIRAFKKAGVISE